MICEIIGSSTLVSINFHPNRDVFVCLYIKFTRGCVSMTETIWPTSPKMNSIWPLQKPLGSLRLYPRQPQDGSLTSGC